MEASATRHQTIGALNCGALNRAAAALLPADWLDTSTLHVLGLALWGTENGIGVELPGRRITDDDVRDALLGLLRADPGRVMELFEGMAGHGDAMLQAGDLEGASRTQAAFRVLETVRDRLAER